eukprot:6483783-Amphidinium_carterae.1
MGVVVFADNGCSCPPTIDVRICHKSNIVLRWYGRDVCVKVTLLVVDVNIPVMVFNRLDGFFVIWVL